MTSHEQKAALHWGELIFNSHYNALLEIRNSLAHGEVNEALLGLNEYIEVMAKQDVHASVNHLINIMVHVLKWKYQPKRRSRSWLLSIQNARFAIEDIQQTTPSVTDLVLKSNWDKALKRARLIAADQMEMERRTLANADVTHDEALVFEYPYSDLPLFKD